MSSTSLESSDPGSTEESSLPAGVAAAAPMRQTSYNLPASPVVIIKPSRSWSPLDLRLLWSYRELLYFLMWRDIKVRYKQTVLGALWAIIQPLTMMIIFSFFFSRLARIPTEDIPSAVFYYTALTAWIFFSNAALNGANSLLGNTTLITKVYFPRLIIPTAAIGAGVVDLAIASVLLVALIMFYNIPLTWEALLIFPLSILLTVLALGVGILFSAVNAKYRDVRYALPFVLQLWMFLSPIIYPLSIVPEEWRWLLYFNPLTGVIEGFRTSLFGKPIDWIALAYSLVFAVVLLITSAYAFRRMERSFAEVI